MSFLCTGSACGMYSGRWSGAGNYDQVPAPVYHYFDGSGLLHVSLWSRVPARWVAELPHFNADPELAFHIITDPDLLYQFNVDPDPIPHQCDADLQPLAYRHSLAPSM